jgi:hypothetical protein
MPHYFFNIRVGKDLKQSLDAVDMPDVDSVRREAMASAREMVAELLRSGASLDSALSRSFEVMDEAGKIVLALPFSESVRDVAAETVEPETNPGFLSPKPGPS